MPNFYSNSHTFTFCLNFEHNSKVYLCFLLLIASDNQILNNAEGKIEGKKK